MKLIIQSNRIAATATDDYTGPDEYIAAPPDFDPARMGEYVTGVDGWAIPATDPREAAKQARAAAVENIKVTTAAGNTFDGDEISQSRMSRAILVLSTGAAASVPWVLADNTVIQADAVELTEALALAGAAQAALWVLP